MLSPSAVMLRDKVAVVTGGGRGIGRAICEAFSAFGARVLVVDIQPTLASETVAEIKRNGGEAVASVTDVREEEQVTAMVNLAYEKFGQVDILVNNVGDFLNMRKHFVDNTDEDWEAQYQINLKHIFLCSRAIAPQMIQRDAGGSIINVSTVEAFRAIPGLTAYSTFKGAITQFTKSFAMEVAQYRIRVNTIAPDVIETPQVNYRANVPSCLWHMWPYWVPLGRHGTPDDVAGVAVFLASDLSRFVTGTTIHVDGGTWAAGGWYRTERGPWTNKPEKP